jgi:hypothetical protein
LKKFDKINCFNEHRVPKFQARRKKEQRAYLSGVKQAWYFTGTVSGLN